MAALDVLLGQEADNHLHLSEQLNAVTGDEIHSLAKELFQDDRSMIVTVSP